MTNVVDMVRRGVQANNYPSKHADLLPDQAGLNAVGRALRGQDSVSVQETQTLAMRVLLTLDDQQK